MKIKFSPFTASSSCKSFPSDGKGRCSTFSGFQASGLSSLDQRCWPVCWVPLQVPLVISMQHLFDCPTSRLFFQSFFTVTRLSCDRVRNRNPHLIGESYKYKNMHRLKCSSVLFEQSSCSSCYSLITDERPQCRWICRKKKAFVNF